MNFKIITFGCKVNQYESAVINDGMEENGFTCCKIKATPDILIINSCTVTDSADKKALQAVMHCRNQNKNTIIALCGCFVRAFYDKAVASNADIVIGISDPTAVVNAIVTFIKEKYSAKLFYAPEIPKYYINNPSPLDNDKTRAFVKIEDGCNCNCTYCIIPKARGSIRSRSLAEIKEEIMAHANSGKKEVVLVGINLSCYGRDIGKRLIDAVETACSVPQILRVRLSSLEPELISDEDIKRLTLQKKFCPHFHLSLQSGSDGVLKRMNRHYTVGEYKSLIDKLRANFNNVAITTDMMIGFPGETDQEFNESLEFARLISFSKMHIFTYSVRPGTVAATLEQVEDSVKTARYKVMSVLDKTLQKAFLEKQIGSTASIIIERGTTEAYTHGLTENHTEVRLIGSSRARYEVVNVRLIKAFDSYIVGEEQL